MLITNSQLKAMRTVLQMTLRKVAGEVGISPATIWRAERGDCEVGYRKINALISFYEQEYERILNRKNRKGENGHD